MQCGKLFLPSALTGEMGVRKKRTEETMTTTRLTQLATEWVTGDTLARIMYESCHCQDHCQLQIMHFVWS